MGRRDYGEGSVYQRADGRWSASIELGWKADGTRHRKTFTGKTKADVLRRMNEAKKTADVWGANPLRQPTVSEWFTEWLDDICAPRVKPKTLDGYRSKVKLINQSIGRVRLTDMTPAHVRAMNKHAASGGRSSTSALGAYRLLRKAVEDARREGLIMMNPCDLVDAPRKAVFEPQPLTADQAKQFLRHVQNDEYAARWALALLFGMRQGEVLGLTWNDVDFENKTIHLQWQLQRMTWKHGCSPACGKKRGIDCPDKFFDVPAGLEHRLLEGAYVLTRPKRNKKRMIPMIPFIEAALRLRMQQSLGRPNPHNLVFAHPDGQPRDHTKDHKMWHDALDGAGLPSIRLHDARHTAATLLLEAGVDITIIQAILGHSDVVMTRHYQFVSLALAHAAVEGLAGQITA
jgi:integrase